MQVVLEAIFSQGKSVYACQYLGSSQIDKRPTTTTSTRLLACLLTWLLLRRDSVDLQVENHHLSYVQE